MDSEQLLEQALRAQAVGMPMPGHGPATHAGPPPAQPEPSRLPAAWVLLIALVLGMLAGAVAGLVTVL